MWGSSGADTPIFHKNVLTLTLSVNVGNGSRACTQSGSWGRLGQEVDECLEIGPQTLAFQLPLDRAPLPSAGWSTG